MREICCFLQETHSLQNKNMVSYLTKVNYLFPLGFLLDRLFPFFPLIKIIV